MRPGSLVEARSTVVPRCGCRRRNGLRSRAACRSRTRSLQADACGPSYKYDSLTRLQLEKKEDMRRRGVSSPDEWDAVALTFAEPVVEHSYRALPKRAMNWVV